MNETVIKNLIRLGLRNRYENDTYEKIDLTSDTFRMVGRHIVTELQFQSVGILPKIIFFPADPLTVIDDYWCVAVCMGPVQQPSGCSGITTLPFSFRPWSLRLPEFTCDKTSMYEFILCVTKYNFPKDLLLIIFAYLKMAPPKNKILKAVY